MALRINELWCIHTKEYLIDKKKTKLFYILRTYIEQQYIAQLFYILRKGKNLRQYIEQESEEQIPHEAHWKAPLINVYRGQNSDGAGVWKTFWAAATILNLDLGDSFKPMCKWSPGSKLRKEYVKAVYCHPTYLTYMQSTSWEILDWKNTSWNQDPGEISITSDMQIHQFMAESKDELKTLLMKVKEESEKAGLKLSIQKTKIMASSPITSWQIDGETVETVTDFFLLVSKIIADGDFSHEIKRRLLLGRKAMTNVDSILKSRDITLLTKVHVVKALVFPVVIVGP